MSRVVIRLHVDSLIVKCKHPVYLTSLSAQVHFMTKLKWLREQLTLLTETSVFPRDLLIPKSLMLLKYVRELVTISSHLHLLDRRTYSEAFLLGSKSINADLWVTLSLVDVSSATDWGGQHPQLLMAVVKALTVLQ